MSERLRQFAALVETWSARINLVSKRDLLVLWPRHVEDSLALVPHIPAGTDRAIDLGSGAGFPGMVLAIETGIPFTLIESDTRKAIFLREAARLTGAPVTVINTRIETAQIEPAPLLAPGGVCLFPKGRDVQVELTAARPLWHMDVAHYASPLDAASCLLKISELRHVDARPAETPPRDRGRQPEGRRR